MKRPTLKAACEWLVVNDAGSAEVLDASNDGCPLPVNVAMVVDLFDVDAPRVVQLMRAIAKARKAA